MAAVANDAAVRTADALYRRRKVTNAVSLVLACLAAGLGLLFLGWILWTLVAKGIGGIDWALFTQDTPPPMSAGGLRNAFFGSAVMCLMAIGIGTPLGIAAGTWLAEYGRNTRLGTSVRFVNDILLSAPSIVLGLFVYTLLVMQAGGNFSAVAGAVSLAFIVLPVVLRTTDEMLRLVPAQMREAALSLGVPQWKVIVQVMYRSAMPGIVTGILLALARISGETAPLLFTAFGNNFMAVNPLDKMASLPVAIYQYTNAPDPRLHAVAWAGALLITLFVLALSLVARLFMSRNKVSHD